ncbi:DUF397 domain-containing protein [Gandjariella thermophila]|uniref:DUF397 domain-containing protein n=1 Tax=Gandjariella thermophila TaxID=1931992 RepID=A0A4D4J0M4_9PSEU|nr:DUF397 domain-containing protein [Gandjariella thermophila]GDY30011.1 hypothetical protein GTS_16440 [Gandjariella thermophila]
MDLSRAVWRRSSRSQAGGGNCVEVAWLPKLVAVRDSKNTAGPVLVFSPAAWTAFIGAFTGS